MATDDLNLPPRHELPHETPTLPLYRVTAPLVGIRMTSGGTALLYVGDLVPSAADYTHLEHLLAEKLIEPIRKD